MSAGLVRLALRRALPRGLVALALLLAAAFLASVWRPDATEALALAATGDPDAAAAGLAREGLWTALLLTLTPFLLARAAATMPTWRRGEVDWLLAAARSRASVVASTYAGLLVAGLVLVAFVALVAELGAGPAGSGEVLAARFATPVLVVDQRPVARKIDAGEALEGGRLRVHLLMVGGGASAVLRFSVHATGAAADTTTLSARLASAGTVEVPLPAARGPYEVVIERTEGDALVAVRENGLELVAPTGGARSAGARIAVRAAASLAALLALALALGAWLSLPTAVLGTLSVALAALLADGHAARRLPLVSLREALRLAGEGLAAPWPSTTTLAIAAAGVLVGLGLSTAGLHAWRRAG